MDYLNDVRVEDFLYNVDAEEAVCSGAVIDPDAMSKILNTGVSSDMFSNLFRQAFFQSLVSLYEEGKPLDPLSVNEELKRYYDDDDREYMSVTLMGKYFGYHHEHYAKIVVQRHNTRRMMAFPNKILEVISDGPEAMHTVADELLRDLAGVGNNNHCVTWRKSFDNMMGVLDYYASQTEEEIYRYALPFDGFGNQTGTGPKPGSIAVIAATPGSGKTILANQIAERYAEQGVHSAVFNYELSEEEILKRRACRNANVTYADIETNRHSDQTVLRITEASNRMLQWPGKIDYFHCPGMDVEQLLREADACGAEVLFIDYLQIMPSLKIHSNGRATDDVIIAGIISRIKDWASKRGKIVFLLSQTNRSEVDFKKKGLNVLRGSGQIGEKANFVLLLHSDEMDREVSDEKGKLILQPGDLNPITKVAILKNTFGKTGRSFRLMRQGKYFKFCIADIKWVNLLDIGTDGFLNV